MIFSALVSLRTHVRNVYSVSRKVSNGSSSANKLLHHQPTLFRSVTGLHLHRCGQTSNVTLRLSLTIRPTQIFLVNFTDGFRNGLSLLSFHDICHQRNCIVIYSNLNFVPHEIQVVNFEIFLSYNSKVKRCCSEMPRKFSFFRATVTTPPPPAPPPLFCVLHSRNIFEILFRFM